MNCFVQVSHGERYMDGSSLLLGFVVAKEADTGIQIFEDGKDIEEGFGMIFSMDVMKKLTRQIDKLQFYAVARPNSHVELVDKEWVDVNPSSPNSYEFYSTIFSCLNASSLDKICIMEITE